VSFQTAVPCFRKIHGQRNGNRPTLDIEADRLEGIIGFESSPTNAARLQLPQSLY
jgi:hypothetical protein